MSNIGEKIQLFHNLFLIFLVLALLCLVIAVVVFFILDIRSVLGYLTGRRAKKKIKELEEATSVSGRLMPRERSNMLYVAQKMKDDMGVPQKAKPGMRKVVHAVENAVPTTEKMEIPVIHQPSSIPQSTDVLNEGAVNNAAEMVAGELTAMLEAGKTEKGKFLIVRELMLIHTEEVI